MTSKFGIEIECFGVARGDLQRELTDNGIMVQVESWNHEVRHSRWKITTDSSVTGDAGHGTEIVSPPLAYNERSFEQIRKVCAVLNGVFEASVNKTCGLHVHFDASELDAKQILMILKRYARFEQLIDGFMPKSRRANNGKYCRSLTYDHTNTPHQWRTGIVPQTCETKAEIAQHGVKFTKVNVVPLSDRGTIEFRHHSGTTDATKIINWVKFLHQFIARSSALVPMAPETPAAVEYLSPEARFLKLLSNYGSSYIPFTTVTDYMIAANYRVGDNPDNVMYSFKHYMQLQGMRKRRGWEGYELDRREITRKAAIVLANVPTAPAPVATAELEDNLWAGIDDNLKDFYINRATELSVR